VGKEGGRKKKNPHKSIGLSVSMYTAEGRKTKALKRRGERKGRGGGRSVLSGA